MLPATFQYIFKGNVHFVILYIAFNVFGLSRCLVRPGGKAKGAGLQRVKIQAQNLNLKHPESGTLQIKRL